VGLRKRSCGWWKTQDPVRPCTWWFIAQPSART
jgi:hypothetical protein